jgi:hypothetical protein
MSDLLEGSKNITNNIANNGIEMYNNTAASASNMVSSGVTSINSSIEIAKDYGERYINDFSTVFFALIILVIISFLIGYGLYILITEKVIYQQRMTISGTDIPVICNEIKEFKITESIDTTNGNRRSFSFWIYLNDINKNAGMQYRHIAHIGETVKNINNATPYIFLDNVANKIHIRFAPKTDLLNPFELLNNVRDLNTLLQFDGKNQCGFTIEYIPIQRWVHVAVAVNDSKFGSIYVYVDAELIDVKENKDHFIFDVSKLKLDSTATKLYTGGNINDTLNGVTGFSGLISKFTIFNYDLNQNDVYKEYNNGPFSGLLTRLGLTEYGLRTPIYKISDGTS